MINLASRARTPPAPRPQSSSSPFAASAATHPALTRCFTAVATSLAQLRARLGNPASSGHPLLAPPPLQLGRRDVCNVQYRHHCTWPLDIARSSLAAPHQPRRPSDTPLGDRPRASLPAPAAAAAVSGTARPVNQHTPQIAAPRSPILSLPPPPPIHPPTTCTLGGFDPRCNPPSTQERMGQQTFARALPVAPPRPSHVDPSQGPLVVRLPRFLQCT